MTSTSVRVLLPFGASGASLAKPGILQTDLTDLEGTRESLRAADQLARRREDTRRAKRTLKLRTAATNPESGTPSSPPTCAFP